MTLLPGEVHLADLFEGGLRPVIIVSREQLNRGTLYLGVPVTASRIEERRRYANYVFLSAGAGACAAMLRRTTGKTPGGTTRPCRRRCA